MDKGVPVRVIVRTLAVLKVINRGKPLTMMEISQACNLPYPTTSRIIQSLIYEGMVKMEPDRKTYLPTALTQTLSYGFQDEHEFAALTRSSLIDLTKKIGWPAAISTRVADSMVIRDSTHSLTTMTFTQYFPGWSVPIWSSASGKVHLAFCSKEERENIIASANLYNRLSESENTQIDTSYLEAMISQVRQLGYASTAYNKFSKNPGKTSSIAIPVERNGEYFAALAIIFFSSTMNPDQAAEKYLDDMLIAKESIKQAVSNGNGFKD